MLYTVIKRVVLPLARAVYRPKVEGLENLPRTGAVILAPNHLSFIDSILIPMVAPRRVAFLAKAEYFEGAGLKGRLSKSLFSSLGHVPVKRGSGRAARASLDTAAEILAGGNAFAIYPEGTRSLDGRLHRGRTGVARMALESDVPVIPVGIIGTDQVQPVGRRLPRIRPVTIRFGAPLDFSRYAGMQDSLPVLRSVTDEIVYRILELSEQEYVDRYQASGGQVPGGRTPGGQASSGQAAA
ncbi:1-acyl-sn-glycerol-3-phosphate acyltransferase [Actinosynnema pretiosum subsp. pretiosum]|uniref:1-acyl-sn-glycerol-3-phosphate acyltransferase n=1 Tax=Actinosynnema pretiosum subsp. pretiosum TaxID=103721 RepID=A0AA45LB13_9PSEU|nr:1-acyl-sn-glycerol-3-phosphate acyltransferase [Actinosynnema pretiosum subsp. pretiosum]QUF06984.1 1-acyl-sn-glycerol-3-phosphate acyltransferase [Actinosynnema pretiosum subsp. pretiosum]